MFKDKPMSAAVLVALGAMARGAMLLPHPSRTGKTEKVSVSSAPPQTSQIDPTLSRQQRRAAERAARKKLTRGDLGD